MFLKQKNLASLKDPCGQNSRVEGRFVIKAGLFIHLTYWENHDLVEKLVDFRRAVAIIPSLAIHLDRQANEKRSINAQTYLPAIAAQDSQAFSLESAIVEQLASDDPTCADVEVVSTDLSFYPCEKAAYVGFRNEFIASARLDNLLSCFV